MVSHLCSSGLCRLLPRRCGVRRLQTFPSANSLRVTLFMHAYGLPRCFVQGTSSPEEGTTAVVIGTEGKEERHILFYLSVVLACYRSFHHRVVLSPWTHPPTAPTELATCTATGHNPPSLEVQHRMRKPSDIPSPPWGFLLLLGGWTPPVGRASLCLVRFARPGHN